MTVILTSPRLVARITDPSLATALSRFVRARVPESDVEDIVQATLSDALQAEQHPEEDEDIVKWVWGICRHKVVDWFRRMRREVPHDLEGDDAVPAEVCRPARNAPAPTTTTTAATARMIQASR